MLGDLLFDTMQDIAFYQTPLDFVVKPQCLDIIDVILR